jgi:hypothetical protein
VNKETGHGVSKPKLKAGRNLKKTENRMQNRQRDKTEEKKA